jgi:hypothetical protein
MSNDFTLLFFNRLQFNEIQSLVVGAGLDTTLVFVGFSDLQEADAATGPEFRFSIFLGDRLVTENSIRHSRSPVTNGGFTIATDPSGGPPTAELFWIKADLNMWEYAGTLRYNLATKAVQPFLKAGYGLSWYRLEDTRVEFVSAGDTLYLDAAESPWVRQPSLRGLDNLLPNTWHVGLGLEWIPHRSVATFPKGLDFGLRVDYTLFRHKLGVGGDFIAPDLDIQAGEQVERTISRSSFQLGVTLSF